MVKIVWTELSRDDLKEIFDFIATDSQRYAVITTNKIYERVQEIIHNPRMGRVVPEFGNKNIRELLLGNYRIVYRIATKQRVDILRIFHSARFLSDKKLI